MSPLVVAGVIGLVSALIVTRLVELIARRRALLDIPNERSSHLVPTPRVGGIGIVAGTLVGWVAGGGGDPRAAGIAAIGIGIAAVGLVDDLFRMTVVAKYSAQLLAAVGGALLADPSLEIDLLGAHLVVAGPPAVALTAVWLTALINAFNFMDGIDGMTASVAVAAAMVGIFLVSSEGQLLLLAVAAACAGFLIWNRQPASIFMGDVGSHFLGFLVGAALLLRAGGSVGVVPLVLLLAPFLLDTGVTLVRRAASGRNIFAAHREHLYQRLTMAGYSHRSVSIGYALATVLCGLVALAWPLALPGQVVTLAAIAAASVAYVVWVGAVERRASAGTVGDR
jgi:UDP-N-acetylmuramyl pentapeptide phosphotransferase/UDP-N-acetylglucosamine-1-phosphate transferase